MTTIAAIKADLQGAILREVNSAKDMATDAHSTIDRIIQDAAPENGLGAALADMLRQAESLRKGLENIATEHLHGTKE